MGFLTGIPLWVFIISMGKLKAQVTMIPHVRNELSMPHSNNSSSMKTTGINHDKDCSYWKDFNYKTFDGEIFNFPGTCNYIFSSHCKGVFEDFFIQIRHLVVNTTVVNTKISMKIVSTFIELLEDTVVVTNASVNLPYSEPLLNIWKIGDNIKIHSGIGLSFTKRGNDGFLLQLHEKYANTTCGLCGDFNGQPHENEFVSDGIAISEFEFGIRQKATGLNDECDDENLIILSSCPESATTTCENAILNPPVALCNTLLDPAYITACIKTLCTCEEESYNSCICPTLSEYSYQCIHNGGVPENWRTEDLCPKTCPLNMEYQECSLPCFNTCTNPKRQLTCDDYCMSGCYCPEGLIYDDIKNGGCIPIEECSCTYNGNIYKPGQSYMNSCRSCYCASGQWLCEEIPCSATCAVEGGSHITSFDETHFDIHGDCNYVLMKLCNESTIIVLGELRPCGRQESQSCLTSITIILDDDQTIEIKMSGDVFLNWMYTTLPIITGSFTLFRPSPYYTIFNSDIGLHMMIQIEAGFHVYIVVDPSFKSRTCGLCGNFNDQQKDDFQTISGVIEGTSAAFADTWKTAADCPNTKTIYDDPCSLSIETEQYAKYWCGLIRAADDIFSPCHKAVDPTIYYKNCLVDTCNCEKSEVCMCAALAAYNRVCVSKGIVLKDWQIKGCAKYILECQKNLVFTFGITTCLPTCRSLSEPDKTCNVHFDPLPGCTCSKGTYIDHNGRCVPESECPCYYRGIAVLSEESITDNGVTCNCTKGKLFCTSSKSIDCIAPMIYVDCNDNIPDARGVECFKSCRTLDMKCYKSRCIPGCVCPPGLVLNDKGGCIDQMQCPCIHNGITYEPGEEIRIQCNTCTCKNRKWICTKKSCLSTCTVYGDGHYITFDGKSYTFNGDCQYTLVQDHCSLNDSVNTFSVITENVPCGTTGVTCSKSIKVFLEGCELILNENHLTVVQRDPEIEAPYQVRIMGIYLVLEAKNGLLIFWDMKTSIFIKIPSEYKGRLCGLCGNYDDNGNNDFTTRSHAIVGNIEEFGNSWKLSTVCPDAHVRMFPCVFNPYRLSWAQKQCGIITSSVFSVCHPHVDPSNFYDACVSDSCACNTGGDCECFCTAVAAYAQICGESGICVSWREPNKCPLFCDYYNELGECEWHYKPCGAPCLRTCRNPSGKCTYEVRGLEGCYPSCPKERPLFDEDEMKCVSKCGCYDEDRIHYRVGARVPSRKNCYVCTCTEGGIKCTYTLKECLCEYKQHMYKINAIIYNTTDGFGNCMVAICKENGTIYRNVYACATSATPPFTFTTVPSTAPTVVTTMTSTVCEVLECFWSEWFDVDSPDDEQDGGDFETYENIRNRGGNICEVPIEIECGQKLAEDIIIAVSQSEQTIQCDVTFGLTCYNKNQNTKIKLCFNYAIQVKCCSFIPCPTSLTTSPTYSTSSVSTRTTPTTTPAIKTTFSSVTSLKPSTACQPTCRWTPWFSENKVSFGLLQGDTESYKELISKGKQICTHPEAIECRPKDYQDIKPEELKQNVECDLTNGLVCRNRDQISNQGQCYDYEIRFYCCDNYSHCSTTFAPTTSKITSLPTSSTIIKSTVLSTVTQPELTTQTTPPTTTKETVTSSKSISTTTISTTSRPTTTTVPVTSSKAQITPKIGTAPKSTYSLSTAVPTGTKISSPTTSKGTVTISKSTVTPQSTGTPPKMTTSTTSPTTTKETVTSSKSISTTTISTTSRPTTTTAPVTSSKAQITPKIGTAPKSTYSLSTAVPTGTKISSPTTSKGTVTISKSTVAPQSTGTPPKMTTSTTSPTTTKETVTSSKSISTTTISTTSRPTTTTAPVTSSKAQITPKIGTAPKSTYSLSTAVPTGTKISSPTTSKGTVTISKSTVTPQSTGTPPKMTTSTTSPTTTKETVTSSKSISTTTISTTSRPTTTTAPVTSSKAQTTSTQFRTSTHATSVPTSTQTTQLVTSPGKRTSLTTPCRCKRRGYTFSPGEVMYSSTDASGCTYSICNKDCHVEMVKGTCRSTSTSQITSQSTSTTTVQSTETTIEGCPPRKKGESWHTGNCTIATCAGNNKIDVSVMQCETEPILDCGNGFTPDRVYDAHGCCFSYECPCVCAGDSPFMTFDGLIFTNEDMCTQILVEQIDKLYDDFKILLENTYCNKMNKRDCPQTLWIVYNRTTIGLKSYMNANQEITKEITFNNETVNSGFHKDGIDVFNGGISMLVDIPAIDVHIFYSGVAFIIQLPYGKFGNNTEGLCGTCNNDPSDDCRFPDTRNISDCSETVPHWNADKVLKPECKPPVPTIPITECPPSSICSVIKSLVFAPCHRIIRPENYYLSCLNNCGDECKSIELYASQCFMQGICIDWRESVESQCSYQCPLDQIYKPCDTVLRPTCDKRNLSMGGSHMVEICRCPPGWLFFNNSRDRCVQTCNCLSSNGTEKFPGDIWESGCKICSCDESMKVQCEKIGCPEPEIPTCDKTGQVVVEVFNSNSTCCPTKVCRCKVSHCPTAIPMCGPGYYLVSYLENGECCFSYECKPMNVCVAIDTMTVLQPGDTYVNNTNLCETCVCSEEMDNETGLKLLSCIVTECNTTCPQDFEYKVKSGQCCGECIAEGCNMTMGNGQYHIIKAGTETFYDPANKCIYYQCIQDKGQYILYHLSIDCNIKNASYCKPGYEYQVKKDNCCGDCVQVACIYIMMDNTSKAMQLGDTWENPDQPCEFFKCILLDNMPIVVIQPKTCPSRTCQPGFIENPDKCCGDHCIPESCVLKLENNVAQVIEPGKSWSPPDDKCISYTCDLMFVLTAIKIHCPPFDSSQCQEGTLGIADDGCCLTCKLKLKADCVQLQESRYITHLGCISQEPVELSYCNGECFSSSTYSDISEAMENNCDCCKPTKGTTKEVTLYCVDGSNMKHLYIYVEKCECTPSICLDFDTTSTTYTT